MYPLKQSTAITVPFFVHDSSGDAVTGLTDGSFTKRISKGSGAFAAMTVTISEMENGWYSFPLSTSHSDTLGLLTIVFTNAGAKQVNLQFRVGVRLADDLAYPTTSGRSIDVTTGGAVGIDWANVENPTTAVDLSGTDIQLVDTASTVTGGATEAKQDTAQSDLDLLTGADGATLATSQPNYAPATAAALTTHDGKLDTAQADLDILTGSDGVTLATTQGNYAPAKAGDSMALTAAAVDAIHDEVMAGTTTFREAVRGFIAALLGKADGMATATGHFRDIADSMNVITVTQDADGNRTAVTLDLDDTP